MLDALLRLIRPTPVKANPSSSAGCIALELHRLGLAIVCRPGRIPTGDTHV